MNTIRTKVPLSLMIADAFINGIEINCQDLMRDFEFSRRLNYVREYIDSLSDTGLDTEVLEQYCVVEQAS